MNHEAAELAALRLAPVPVRLHRPSADQRLADHRLFPQRRADRAGQRPGALFGKAGEAAQHRLPLRAAGVRAGGGDARGTGPSSGRRRLTGARNRCSSICRSTTTCSRASRANVGDCQFVFIRHFGKGVTELFQQRLDRAFAAAGLKAEDHCVFLHSMDMNRFAAASAQCDVMLDSIGWSGGNTTLEALAQDLPVITFEGELMRGRVSAGMLRMMGMPETIAGRVDDYVALADPHWPGRRLADRAQDARCQRQAPALPRPRLHCRAGRFPRPRRAPRKLRRLLRSHCQRVAARVRGRDCRIVIFYG